MKLGIMAAFVLAVAGCASAVPEESARQDELAAALACEGVHVTIVDADAFALTSIFDLGSNALRVELERGGQVLVAERGELTLTRKDTFVLRNAKFRTDDGGTFILADCYGTGISNATK